MVLRLLLLTMLAAFGCTTKKSSNFEPKLMVSGLGSDGMVSSALLWGRDSSGNISLRTKVPESGVVEVPFGKWVFFVLATYGQDNQHLCGISESVELKQESHTLTIHISDENCAESAVFSDMKTELDQLTGTVLFQFASDQSVAQFHLLATNDFGEFSDSSVDSTLDVPLGTWNFFVVATETVDVWTGALACGSLESFRIQAKEQVADIDLASEHCDESSLLLDLIEQLRNSPSPSPSPGTSPGPSPSPSPSASPTPTPLPAYIMAPQDYSVFTSLPHDYILDIATLGLNEVYVATRAGLAYSNDAGASFVTRSVKNGLPTAEIEAIGVDSIGRLYVGTEFGLYISDDNGETFTSRTTADGLASDDITDVSIGTNNEVFVGSSFGLSVSTDRGASFTTKTTAHGLGSNVIRDVAMNSSDIWFVATTGGGYASSGDSGVSFVQPTTPSMTILDVEVDSSDILYIASTSGLAISNDNGVNYSLKTTAEGLPSNTIYTVDTDSSNNIYAGTSSAGLTISTDGGSSFFNKNTGNGLISNSVFKAVVSASDKLYLATPAGVSTSTDTGSTFSNVVRDQIPSPTASKVLARHGADIYVGSNDGLYKTQNYGETFTKFTTANGLGGNLIHDIFIDTNGDIYVGTDGGLSVSTDGGTSFTTFTTSNGLASNVVRSVLVDSNGDIYAGNAGISISSDGGTSFTTRTMSDGLGSLSIWDLAIIDGDLFASTNGGLAISTDSGVSFSNKTTIVGLAHDGIQGVAKDSGGKLFVATNQGLGVSTDNGATFTNRNTGDGLIDHVVTRVAVDASDHIYVGTNKGVSISTDGGNTFSTFAGLSEGLSRDIRIADMLFDQNGDLIILSNAGFMVPSSNFR